jgi:predicted Zn-dependent protease
MRRPLLILAALLASMSLVLPNAGASHRFVGHWRTVATPFNVRFIDSATSSWDGVMAAAAADWSESNVLDAVIEPGNSSRSIRRQCPPADGAVRICNFGYGNTGWVGLTVAVVRNGHFKKVAVKLNSTYLGQKNRKVMCHEMGHGLGLGHRAETTSCMKQGTASATPDGHDYRMLKRIYGHLHTLATASEADDGETQVIRIPYPVEELGR